VSLAFRWVAGEKALRIVYVFTFVTGFIAVPGQASISAVGASEALPGSALEGIPAGELRRIVRGDVEEYLRERGL